MEQKFTTENGFTGTLVGDRKKGTFTLDERSKRKLARYNLSLLRKQNKPS